MIKSLLSKVNTGKKEEGTPNKYLRYSFVMLMSVLILSLAVIPKVTKAWFSVNSQIGSENTALASSAGDASLFVELGDITTSADYQDDYYYTTSVAAPDFTGKLFHISPKNSKEWYYPTSAGWRDGRPISYYLASISMSTDRPDRGIYTNTVDGDEYVAFNKVQYTLYVNDGCEMDVYLDSDNGITVSGDGTDNNKRLIDALRVGITTGTGDDESDFVLVYAPSADTAYYHVTGVDGTVSAHSAVTNDLSAYSAVYDTETGSYEAGNTNLFSVDYDGTVVNVYVWIEGTDPETEVGVSDGASGISVSFSFVGIEN